MVRITKIFFLFAFVFMAFSCGGSSYDRRLVEIDSLTMNGGAQRAIELLDSMGDGGFSTADKMYYELLKIKAKDKVVITHETDSMILKVVDYCEKHDRGKLAEAYYYAGSVYRDLRDAPQSVAYFQKCIGELKDECTSMKSNAYFQCGEMFRISLFKQQAADMFLAAYRIDSLMNDTLKMANSLSHIGPAYATYMEKENYDDSLYNYLNHGLELAQKINNDYEVQNISYIIAFFHNHYGEYGKMRPYMKNIEDYLDKNKHASAEIDYKCLMLDSLMATGQYAKAEDYCNSIIENGSWMVTPKAYKHLFRINAERGDYRKAHEYMNKYEEKMMENAYNKAQEATAQANAFYNYQLRERDNLALKAENQERLYLIFILTAVVLLVVGSFWFYRIRQKQKLQTLNQQVARLHQLEKMQKEQNEQTATQQDFTRQRLFDSEAYAMLKQRLAKNKPLKRSDLAMIDGVVNQICDGFKSTLYSAYNLSEQEYAVCLLLKFELSTTEMSNLLSRTKSAITMGRKRLFVKLFGRGGDANDLDIYIRSL